MPKNSYLIIFFVVLSFFIYPASVFSSEPIHCTGGVVDADGMPVAGAKVTVYEMQFDGIAGNFMLKKGGEKTTADDGSFSFEAMPKPPKSTFYDCKIVAVKPGMALGWAVWSMKENAEVEIELGRPEKIEGIIVDEAGKPVAGADVRANLSRVVKTAGGEEKSQWLPGISPLEELDTQTDSQGRFFLNNIPADLSVDLLVTSPGKALTYTYKSELKEAAFKAGQTDIKVVLPEEARIEGKIIDINSGKGIGGLKFAVVYTHSGLFFYRFVCVTNDDGTFETGRLLEGKYLIRGDFPSVEVDLVSGKCTDKVLIGVNRREGEQIPKRNIRELGERLQIYYGMEILEVPFDLNDVVIKPELDLSSGIFVRSGREFADRLLELARQDKDVKLLYSPQILTFVDDNASMSISSNEYVCGYESADDDSGQLEPKMKSLTTDFEIRGIRKDDDMIYITLSAGLREPVFERRQYREGYDYQVPLPGQYLSAEGLTKNNEPIIFGWSGRDNHASYLIINPSCLLPEPEPESLIGKALPGFDNIKGVDLNRIEGKPILVCFFDIQQRPSRNCIMQLNKGADELKEQDLAVVAIQASKIEQEKLNEWIKDKSISFPVGTIEAEEDKTRLKWGIKSLPWLIITSEEHAVTAEGFKLDELYEKLEQINEN